MEVLSVKLPTKEDIVNAATIAKTSYYDEGFSELKKKMDYATAKEFLKKLISGDRPSNRHESIIEPLVFTFNITGVTRVLTHQLVRHRIASYLEKSFRKKRAITLDSFLLPESKNADQYDKAYKAMANLYNKLVQAGEDPEDARLLLPQGLLTEITITINARSLRNLLTQRLAPVAGKEFQQLSKLIVVELIENDLGFLVEDILDKYNKGLL